MAGSNHYVYRAFDANGKPLPHGEYRAFIEATNTKIDVDENGNKTRTKDIVPVQQKIAQPIKAYISSLDGADPMVELKNGMQIPIDRVKKVIANDLNQAQAAAEQPTDPRKSMNALQWEKWGRAKFEQEQAEQKAQAAATQPAN